jgi:hypothetical protein
MFSANKAYETLIFKNRLLKNKQKMRVKYSFHNRIIK